jgi:WD40 repeat protein
MFFLSIAAVSAGTFERDAVKVDLTSQEFRSLAVSSDGKYLAAGDCRGNLHIYNLQTSEYTCLQVSSGTCVYLKLLHNIECILLCSRSFVSYSCTFFQGAHDAEILTLSFTLSTQDKSGEIAKNSYFLASGGRDCIIHLYDVERCSYGVLLIG